MATSGHFENKLPSNLIINIMQYVISDWYRGVEFIFGPKMIILGFKALKFDKKQNLLILAHIMHIVHFLNLYGADMRLISCRWVTFV